MPPGVKQYTRLVQLAQTLLGKYLRAGDRAIDATLGNGHDTLFLARSVGEDGRVYGFDIQQSALENTWQRLDQAGLAGRVSLYQAGHESMAIQLSPSLQGQVRVVMFNLGYLPGGDRQRTTAAITTLAALQQALLFLAPGGLLSVMAYTGHPGGREEAEAVKAWAYGLAGPPWHVTVQSPPGTGAPEWILVMREPEQD